MEPASQDSVRTLGESGEKQLLDSSSFTFFKVRTVDLGLQALKVAAFKFIQN